MMICRSHDKTLYAWIVNAAERKLHTLKRISPHKVALLKCLALILPV